MMGMCCVFYRFARPCPIVLYFPFVRTTLNMLEMYSTKVIFQVWLAFKMKYTYIKSVKQNILYGIGLILSST